MPTRYKVIGLEDGKKRDLTWLDGDLIGSDDLKARFEVAWQKVNHEEFRASIPKDFAQDRWREYLAGNILKELFVETLDFEYARLRTPEELQEWADAWNAHEDDDDEYYTADRMGQIEEDDHQRYHQGPPFDWEEIKRSLRRKDKHEAMGNPPDDIPKCLQCLQPMEWIWFSSSSRTWASLCGCAGWTAICRKCRTWRKCRVRVMN